MSPANIEATIKSAGSVIGCVCAIGDARPYNVALVTLDPDVAATVAGSAGRGGGADRPRQREARARRADQAVQRAAVDWLPGGDELTPTMKLKRKPIAAKYAAEIEALYT